MTATSCLDTLALTGRSTAAVGTCVNLPPYVEVMLSTATSFQPTGSGYGSAAAGGLSAGLALYVDVVTRQTAWKCQDYITMLSICEVMLSTAASFQPTGSQYGSAAGGETPILSRNWWSNSRVFPLVLNVV
jgi:hypothetical protein